MILLSKMKRLKEEQLLNLTKKPKRKKEVKSMSSLRLTAEDEFIIKIKKMGFELEYVTSIKDLPVFTVDNENF
jgi:hypothetical protein